MKNCLLLSLALSITGLTARAQAPAQETDGWKTILATKADLKDYPAAQATLEEGLLRVRAGNGILIPQPTPDGAIRARFHFREGTGFPQLRIRRNGNAEAKNTDYYEVILFIRPGQTSIKEGYVNVTTRGKGRRIGVVPLPEPFVLGAHIDLELSVVGQHLQVLVNGKAAFETNDSSLSTAGYWGVAALDASFSSIQVRSLTASGAAQPPSKQAKSTDPRLIQLEDAYATALQREVSDPHQRALKDLNDKYLAALTRAHDAATQAGSLDAVLALQTEKKRLEDQAPLPADDTTAAESLKPLRLTYRSSLSQLETERQQRLQPLREKFLQALEAYQGELTRANNLDAALEVRQRRELEARSAEAN